MKQATKLTKQVCERAAQGSVVRDGVIGGLYLKCGLKAKTFIYQRDIKDNGVRRTVHEVIGRFDKGVTCEAARAEALALLNEPQRLASGGITFAEAWALFATSNTKSGQQKADKTLRRYTQFIDSGYLATWMDRPLRAITRVEVRDRHQSLPKEITRGDFAGAKKAQRRPNGADGRTTANDVMRFFRAVWNRAMKQDETLPVCPTINVDWFSVEKKRSAIPAKSLKEWHRGVLAIDNPVRRDYLLFVLYSGLRRASASAIRWTDLDMKARVLHIPKPKGGEARAFDLPLSKELVTILVRRKKDNKVLAAQQQIPAESLDWVWPSFAASGHIEEPREDGLGATIHDLRRTFATVAESCDLSPLVIGALLNHAQPTASVTAGYINIETDRLREPMEKIAGKLRELLGKG